MEQAKLAKTGRKRLGEATIQRRRKRRVPGNLRGSMSRRFLTLAGSARDFPYPADPASAEPGPKVDGALPVSGRVGSRRRGRR